MLPPDRLAILWGGVRAMKPQTLNPFILSSPPPARSHICPRAPHPRQWREEWRQALLLLPREGLRGGPESHDPVQDRPDLPGEFITAVGETCRWSSPLKGLYFPHNDQSRPCVFLPAGSFPLIASNCRAPNCNAHQQRGRKQKSALSASAAKFGSGVLLFQLLGMKWSSERVANPGQVCRCAPWRRCLKWHFNRERCADMSYRHKRGVFWKRKRPFVGIVLRLANSVLLGRNNCHDRQRSLACR